MHGDLRGGHAVHVRADGVEHRRDAVVGEVEHQNEHDRGNPAGVAEELGGDERVGRLVDVHGESHEQHDGEREHPHGVVGEEQREEGDGEADDGEAQPIDLLTVALPVRQVLEQQRQEKDGDGRNEEQVLPGDGAQHTGREHADGSGDLVAGGEQTEEHHLERGLQVFAGHDQERRAGDLLTCGLQHAGDDDGPEVRGEEEVCHKAEDRADEQSDEADHDEFLQGDEVAERAVDKADDAEHDARDGGDQRGLGCGAHILADLREDKIETLQAQRTEDKGDEQRDQGLDGHRVAGFRIRPGVGDHGCGGV